ncbi:hypothetical protein [Clostridium cibarium]|uniref:Uncharacterized protein n=1 Tax=Clostridium cibarium TaxID=2762247 RepID=A0ABR8PNI9_9CLOT|nr:hypothetical protein [Clostridium cibarium]MBD7909728.1 hypothetical protein [Clostridium cibarium]
MRKEEIDLDEYMKIHDYEFEDDGTVHRRYIIDESIMKKREMDIDNTSNLDEKVFPIMFVVLPSNSKGIIIENETTNETIRLDGGTERKEYLIDCGEKRILDCTEKTIATIFNYKKSFQPSETIKEYDVTDLYNGEFISCIKGRNKLTVTNLAEKRAHIVIYFLIRYDKKGFVERLRTKGINIKPIKD